MKDELSGAELAILSLLAETPRHGYEIERLIGERGMREWTEIGFSSIYFLLDRLAKRGLASAGAGGGKSRKPFTITPTGRERLAQESLRAIAGPARTYPPLMLAIGNWPLIEDTGAQALDARASALRAEIARLEAARDGQRPLPPFVEAIFDYALGQLATDLDWTERTRRKLETAMEKIDFRKVHKALYGPPAEKFVTVEVPKLQFVKVDGEGDPNTAASYRAALEWLYSTSYAMKFAAKAALGKDYTVPPLEGLWWSDDPSSFTSRRDKSRWKWTMMILAPDFVDAAMFDAAVDKARKKLGDAPATLRLEPYEEGACLQTLHVGSYDDEGPVLAKLHDEVMPADGLTFNGPHHEIYLSDARKVAPEKLRTILRQPVKRA